MRETDLMADCYLRAPGARCDPALCGNGPEQIGPPSTRAVSSARFDDPLAKRQFTDGKGGT